MIKRKKILLIDQDNVMADFNTAVDEAKIKTPGIEFPQCQYKFFENLEPIRGAIPSINKLSKYYDIIFLTRPSVRNPLCYTEKRMWIEYHFNLGMCYRLVICYDKTGQKGDYLIDDQIHDGVVKYDEIGILCGRFEPDWQHIHFGHGKFENWSLITEYLIAESKKN